MMHECIPKIDGYGNSAAKGHVFGIPDEADGYTEALAIGEFLKVPVTEGSAFNVCCPIRTIDNGADKLSTLVDDNTHTLGCIETADGIDPGTRAI